MVVKKDNKQGFQVSFVQDFDYLKKLALLRWGRRVWLLFRLMMGLALVAVSILLAFSLISQTVFWGLLVYTAAFLLAVAISYVVTWRSYQPLLDKTINLSFTPDGLSASYATEDKASSGSRIPWQSIKQISEKSGLLCFRIRSVRTPMRIPRSVLSNEQYEQMTQMHFAASQKTEKEAKQVALKRKANHKDKHS